MLAVLLAHAAAALIAPPCVRRFGRRGFHLLALAPLGSLIWLIAHWNDGQVVHIEWAPSIHMDVDLRLDSLACILSLLVLGIGTLILVYCASYFDDDDPQRLGIFAGYMVAFSGAMFGLVTSDNMILMFTFWEVTTVLSFLLVGHHAEQVAGRRAALQALLVTGAGGLTMLVGIIMIGESCGTYRLSEVVHRADPYSWFTGVAVVLILIGALSKSAIVPLHFWLPGAMAAPTPVSAYLHAAAMVKAGVYLVARLAPVFAVAAPWHPILLTLGLLSMILAGLRSLQVYDLKLVLAFGTVSQLGFMMVLVGIGTPDAALAGATMIVAHAMFKACLFMVVGIIDHSAGTRDMRRLSGLGRRAPVLCGTAILAALSMAGIPPLFGFVGKESALAAIMGASDLSGPVKIAETLGVVIGSMFTVGYSIRFLWGAFGRKSVARQSEDVPEPALHWHRPSALFLAPASLLAVCSLAAALGAPWLDRMLRPYARTLPGPEAEHLALWHGWGQPLTLSMIAIACGLLLFEIRDHIGESATPRLGNADRVYDATLRAMDQLSLRMTGATQRGSLPLNQALILITLILLPVAMLFAGARAKVSLRLWDSPWQLVIGAIMIMMALGATVMRNRLAAVLLVGVTGYGCGAIFALHGAPDLALTQFLVETLTLVIFVLVLRKFPAELQPAGLKVRRAILAALVGTTVAVLAAFAVAARDSEPIWHRIPSSAYQFGGGKNAVNVLLVDIRAWDTLGEISVLLVAATGVASLMFRSRRFGTLPRVADAPGYTPDPTRSYWLTASPLVARRHRSMVLAMTTRLLFPTIMVLSAYFFFSGHNAPGGGFAGGLTAGLALVLRYLAGGRYELAEALPVDAGHLLGAGLALAAGTATGSLLLGAPPLSSAIVEVNLPFFGHVKLVTAMLFDLGVYLIVVGLVLDVLRSLGARLDTEEPAVAVAAPHVDDTAAVLPRDPANDAAGLGSSGSADDRRPRRPPGPDDGTAMGPPDSAQEAI